MGPNAPLIEIPEEEIVDFEVAVRPVPQFNTYSPKMISQGPSVCIFNKEDPGEVLASWLFLQYLLTDEVQIGFSKTEGYVPVTTRAQESEEYLDYLTRSGEDDETYYSVKIAAAKLLIDYVDSSFVTPVFNGSALLRSASGQMIEEVIKGIERGHEINDAFIDKLYGDMRTRYKLDTISVSGRIELGEMPSVSVGLIVGIGGVWALICAYVITDKIRAVRRKRREEERAAGKNS
jgi:multiple sugar transport system substrate-binding protein